jgi:hypothetical protein
MTPPLRPITNAERDGIQRHLDESIQNKMDANRPS